MAAGNFGDGSAGGRVSQTRGRQGGDIIAFEGYATDLRLAARVRPGERACKCEAENQRPTVGDDTQRSVCVVVNK